MTDLPQGVILVNKPSGITSFDVIRKLRKRIGNQKMGHAGTLDPRAEGLMLIGVGSGTKKLAELVGLTKTYEAEIEFGVRTDTGDRDGKVIEEKDAGTLAEDEVRRILPKLVGDLKLRVPAYSAVKQNGVPLYRKARRGSAVEAPIRTMKVYSLDLLLFRREGSAAFAEVRMEVASGVYVRAVAEEIGKMLGFPATVSRLKRTKIGEWELKNALEIEDVRGEAPKEGV